MKEYSQILRIRVGGRWTAKQASIFFSDLNEIYNLRLILELEREVLYELEEYYYDFPFPPRLRRLFRDSNSFARSELFGSSSKLLTSPYHLGDLDSFLEPKELLNVRRIKYASPGAFDFAGLGAIVGHVKDFLLGVIQLHSEKDKRRLENESTELDNQRKKYENAKLLIELADSLGYTPIEKRELLSSINERQDRCLDLAQAEKILSVEVLDDD